MSGCVERVSGSMEMDRIRQIIDWFAGAGLESFELKEGDSRIRLDLPGGAARGLQENEISAEPSAADDMAVASGPHPLFVDAPFYGVCYLSPAPGEPPFVQVGQPVKSGETLCLMEAMKVLNAVTAPRDGIVTEIVAVDGAEIEQGQPLLILA